MAGGTATISKSVFNQLNATPATAHRWAGPTRYDTAVAVANGAKGLGWLDFSEIGVAARVPDAMSGGAAMGMKGGPLLLTETNSLPNATKMFLLYNKPFIVHCTVFGGPMSISEAVRDQITQIIK
ncbi:MAG: cell wall-binding repeat-containing protein [Actinomycetota bacterium]|nr:cell wall-binding repeat-containing protein [Actinomycetota bacterium]